MKIAMYNPWPRMGVKSLPQGQGTGDIYAAFLCVGGGLIFPFVNLAGRSL